LAQVSRYNLRLAQASRYNKDVPKVTFSNLNRTVEFESGKLPYDDHGKPESLLDVAMNFGITLEHACGGSCACTTCHVIVKEGTDGALTPPDEDELDRLDTAPGLTLHSRLGCQAIVKGDVIVEIPAWNINYVSEGGGSMNLGDAIPPAKSLPPKDTPAKDPPPTVETPEGAPPPPPKNLPPEDTAH
jgi:2Fe-2S ferredoxin